MKLLIIWLNPASSSELNRAIMNRRLSSIGDRDFVRYDGISKKDMQAM